MSRLVLSLAAAGASALLLAGCAYDYVQRTDKVGYSHGDAVKANLAAQTANPARDSSYSVKGLGKNGIVPVQSPDGGMEGQTGDEAANTQ